MHVIASFGRLSKDNTTNCGKQTNNSQIRETDRPSKRLRRKRKLLLDSEEEEENGDEEEVIKCDFFN